MKNKVLKEIEKWVGYLEKETNSNLDSMQANAGDENYTIFAKWYKDYYGINFQGQAWCAMFITTCFANALGIRAQERLFEHFSYCPYGVIDFKNRKQWHTSNPQVGDIIMFKDSSGVACHVGIVYKVDNKNVYTIEGNTSSASGVIANGGGVAKKTYSKTYNRILGYCRPNYTNEIAIKYYMEDKVIPRVEKMLPANAITILVNTGIIIESNKWYSGTWQDEDFKWLLRKVATKIAGRNNYFTAVESINYLNNIGMILNPDKWYQGTWNDEDFKWLLRKFGAYFYDEQ